VLFHGWFLCFRALTLETFSDIVGRYRAHRYIERRVMKPFLATAVVVALTFGSVLAQEAAKAGGGKAAGTVAQTLIDMENQWTKASKAGNADALAPMLAEDFVALDSDGSVHTKADVLARTKKASGSRTRSQI
jgi:Domain of unknown function (DUF4440)